MAVKQVIKQKVAMAWPRADDSRGKPSFLRKHPSAGLVNDPAREFELLQAEEIAE